MKRVGHHLELTSSDRRSLRLVEAEMRRRDTKLIAELECQMRRLQVAFDDVYDGVHREWLRALRAKPGSKYDVTARKKKRA